MFESRRVVFILIILVNGHGCTTKLDYEYVSEDDSWLRLHVEPLSWWEARLRCRFEGKPFSNISLQWAEGEPNNVDNEEECVAMTGAGDAIDVTCASARPFICHKNDDKMVVSDCGTTAKGYKRDQRTGSCYRYHRIPRAWHRAAGVCAAEGAHLAVVNSRTEAKLLNELLVQHRKDTHAKGMVHIGFWDWNEHGEWLTIFGETLKQAGFSTWRKDEPNNQGGKEYCGSLAVEGLLNDVSCSTKIAYICEITPLLE